MSDANVNRLGQANNTGSDDALFLKIFAGEVLTAFEETNVMMSRHNVRTITSGKSAQFPVIGKANTEYHTTGTEIIGDNIPQNERVITVDQKLISHVFIDELDEAKNHYDVRAPFSTMLGRGLALRFDKHVMQQAVLAARETTPSATGLSAGGNVTETAALDFNDPDKLAAAIFDAAQILDEKDIPEEDRFCLLPPSRYYALVESAKAINRDFGGAGSYSDGKVFRVAGIEIVKTNNLPTTNITTGIDAGTDAKYAGDFTLTRGLVMHPSAIGTVKILDLAMEAEYDIRRQGHLMVAKYAMGHGILRPECAVELLGTT